MAEVEDLEAIVIDNGTGMIKAGFSGEDAPRTIFSSVTGTIKDPEAYHQRGLEVKDSYVGSEAQNQRELMALTYPIERGMITDWDSMLKIWEFVFSELQLDPDGTTPVMLTDVPLNPKSNREQLAEIMFEQFKVPGFYIASQAVLSLFASGRTRGIVVESGEGVSHAVPVFEGYALPHAIMRMDVAGQDLTRYLMRRLVERGYPFTDAHSAIVRGIKEKMCSVSLDYGRDVRRAAAAGGGGGGDKAYELPDGQVVAIDTTCRLGTSEVLFQPHMLREQGGRMSPGGTPGGVSGSPGGGSGDGDGDGDGGEYDDGGRLSSGGSMEGEGEGEGRALSSSLSGVSSSLEGEEQLGLGDIAFNSIAKCDADLRPDLYSAVVLAGGTSMLPQLKDRLTRELVARAPDGARIRVIPDSQRRYAAWIGGSMFASLSTFPQIQISKQEWDDSHKAVVHRKCL